MNEAPLVFARKCSLLLLKVFSVGAISEDTEFKRLRATEVEQLLRNGDRVPHDLRRSISTHKNRSATVLPRACIAMNTQ
jgi:hypothetical protein